MNEPIDRLPNSEAFVQTPIGRIEFYANAIGGEVDNLSISQSSIEPQLAEGMSVDVCAAILLQFTAKEAIAEFNFCCNWENLNISGSACSGEGLDAWEWETEDYIVLIGTEDSHYLNHRIPSAPYIPDDPNYYPVIESDNKIKICLKNLIRNRKYSLHYVVAWNRLPESASSTWFAVDIPHQKIREVVAR